MIIARRGEGGRVAQRRAARPRSAFPCSYYLVPNNRVMNLRGGEKLG
jgi:hypothetical protein